jgi:GTP-binding protein
MFIDEVKVHLKAGNGGAGCLSFRREKFIPKGGPDGGNGGKGGDVVLLCDNNIGDLEAYRWQPHRSARNGQPGMGRGSTGFNGPELMLHLPPGTQVLDLETGRLVAELTEPGERVILLEGGRGGAGNAAFRNSSNQAPRTTTPGKPGEIGSFRLVMKTIADLGFVGFPNAGKSSLTRILTSARPKVAPYPFTTLHANVGVIEYPDRHGRVFLADIPGLIEGASENRGLGHRFLKHIERCTLLIFLLDMAGSEGRKPLSDYKVLERELRLYSKILAAKPRLVVANKMDLPGAEANLATFRAKVATPIVPVSCLSGSGLDELREVIWKAVKVRPLSTAEPKAAKAKAVTRKVKPAKVKPTKSKAAKVKPTKLTKGRPVSRKTKPLRRKAGR